MQESTEKRPIIFSRKDLANYIGIPVAELLQTLYAKKRSEFYQIATIPKASGGTRTLHKVSCELKSLQRKLLDKLQIDYPPSKQAHGFVPGCSIVTNALPHCKKKIIIKLDLIDFFPSIHYGRVFGMFEAPPFNFGREAAKTLAQIACLGQEEARLLPQGGVLSPYIANSICRRMDKRLASVARKHRCHFTRYADDLTFSTNDVRRLDTEELIAEISGVVKKEGFVINLEKTRILKPSSRQIVTGIVVNDGVNVPRKYLRNLRAIIYNIEKEGIEKQLVKGGETKDSRASRLEFKQDGEGYRLGSRSYTKEEAIDLFLRHLLGRFAFVGQVVNANGQKDRQVRFRRVVLYKRLLKRFHNCITESRHHELSEEINKKFERAIIRLMKQYPSHDQESEWYRRIKEKRKSRLEEWQKSKEGQRVSRALNSISDINGIHDFLKKEAKKDIRYWWDYGNNLEAEKVKAMKYASYPSVDGAITRQVLHGFKRTNDLGAFTHDGYDATPLKLLEILMERYESNYYWLPKKLREKLIDPVSKALLSVILEDGEDVSLDLFNDPRLESLVMKLKEGTRLTSSGRSGHPGTCINQLLQDSYKEGRQRVKKNIEKKDPLKSYAKLPGNQDIYTVVPSLKSALVDIFDSIFRNTEIDDIIVKTMVTQNRCLRICISAPLIKGLQFQPSRDFVHGKLSRAAIDLFGIAGYWIYANFDDGRMYRINMLTGDTRVSMDDQYSMFSHVIVLPNEDGVIEEPLLNFKEPDSIPKSNSQRIIRVLMVDNFEQRRADTIRRWSELQNVDLKGVDGIDQNRLDGLDVDLMLLHESNPEVESNALVFSGRFPVVFFSGGTTVDCELDEKDLFVSSRFLQENLEKLIDRVVRKGQKDCVGIS